MFELTPFGRGGRLSAYDPFRAMEQLEREFFGGRMTAPTFAGTDIVDNGSSYSLITDLPGFRREDINVEISGDTLTLSAERRSDYENRENKNGWVRAERSFGSYRRAFDISGINAEQITAKYEDGVLTLELPKAEKKEPESRKLEIR